MLNAFRGRLFYAAGLVFALSSATAHGQDRLKSMPGYDRHEELNGKLRGAMKPGVVSGTWLDNGAKFEFTKDGKKLVVDVATGALSEPPAQPSKKPATSPPAAIRRRRAGQARGEGPPPARGRQYTYATSPDGTLKAFYRDANLWLGDPHEVVTMKITKDGDDKAKIRYGTACWVYGEELYQVTAMWWSPDSKKIAFYRFDLNPVAEYHLQMNQTSLVSNADVEAYPKAGAPNPIVDLLVYDLASKKTTKVDVRDGKPFGDGVIGHYVYDISWTADSKELLFHRANRRQNVVELAAANPDTGKVRVVVREEWPASWVENSPEMKFLKDGKRFIWASERTGFKNYYLYDLSGKLLATLTNHPFEVGSIVRVDESPGVLWYTARGGDNYLKMQLYRVGLDGNGTTRLTDPAFHHGAGFGPFGGSTFDIAPDGKHFIDVAQTHDKPPATRLVNAETGDIVATLAESDMTQFEKLGLKRVEGFTYKSADGSSELLGLLHKPSNFDPDKKYPVLVSIYAGPATNGASENFTTPAGDTEYGFLVVNLDARSAAGRGKKALDALYLNFGKVEIDDLAAGIKSLRDRPYVDKNRVGVHGTSYGGYASALCLLRYPDVFQAASASSAVTDFRQYDSIYTERYMWLPRENKKGYDFGSAMHYAKDLKGRLLIYYGTADDNVHPNNAMQLIAALQSAGKSFEVQVGPDKGHTAVNHDRMMEFFIENLVLKKPAAIESASRR